VHAAVQRLPSDSHQVSSVLDEPPALSAATTLGSGTDSKIINVKAAHAQSEGLSSILHFTFVFTSVDRGTWLPVSEGINLCTCIPKKYEARSRRAQALSPVR
jgi:hypothetical protein